MGGKGDRNGWEGDGRGGLIIVWMADIALSITSSSRKSAYLRCSSGNFDLRAILATVKAKSNDLEYTQYNMFQMYIS